jgi:hypothetical protein
MSFSSANAWVQNISGLMEQGKPSLLSQQMNSIAPEFSLSAQTAHPAPGPAYFWICRPADIM